MRRRWGKALGRLAAVAAAVAVGTLGFGGIAHAAEPAGLELTLRGAGTDEPVLVLTNRGSAPCQVSATGYGTIAVTRVEQDARPVAPILTDVIFTEGLDSRIAERLRTLDPGGSIELPMSVIAAGPTGHALEIVSWSEATGVLGSLYPIDLGAPTSIDVVYSVPVRVDGSPPVCPVAVGTSQPGSDGTAGLLWLVLLWAGAVLVLSALALLLLLRRRRRARATAAALLALALLGIDLAATARPAAATIVYDDKSLEERFNGCVPIFSMAGGDPEGIFPTITASGKTVRLDRPTHAGDNHTIKAGADEAIVFWDPDSQHPYHGGGGFAHPCTALYHELYHAYEILNGTLDPSWCVTAQEGDTGIRVSEVKATRVENKLRKKLNVPERTHYGKKPLPKGECLPKDQQPGGKTCSGGCGESSGDPHLATFDGVRYDFQAVGEFLAVRDPTGGFQVQVRQRPLLSTRVASVNSAVAMDVAGDVAELGYHDQSGLVLLVDGATRPLETVALPAGGRIAPSVALGQAMTVTWPDGSVVTVTAIGRSLRLTVEPVPARSGRLEGLLGDFDGDAANDIRPRGGAPLAQPPAFDALYPTFADSWRVDAASSLFTYAPGENTDTYTDRTYPDRNVAVDQLANRAWAESICRQFGVTDPVALAACVLDVALSGQPDFAVAAAASQVFVGGLRLDGPGIRLVIATAGAVSRLAFDATAGQKMFVQVVASTLPNQCGVLTLHDPAGTQLASGCILSGVGNIDAVVLEATGRYTVEIDPHGDATGEVTLRLVTATDQRADLVPGGPEVVATIGQAGAVAQFSFSGTAGQKVFVDAGSATLPNECSVLRLRAPDGTFLASGCIISGQGFIDRTLLTSTGIHTVQVDPRDEVTGQVRLRLVVAIDQEGTISLNGPAVTARIGEPGAIARFGFTGTAGQRIFVDVGPATLPNDCNVLRLLAATGDSIVTACIINGAGELSRDGVVLPATGQYSLVVDPSDRGTGAATLRLRT